MLKEIVLEIDGKEIKLTKEQAKKLFDDLKQLFGDGVGTAQIPYVQPIVIPSVWPGHPSTGDPPWRPPYEITCETTTSNMAGYVWFGNSEGVKC